MDPLLHAEKQRILDSFLDTGHPPEPSPLWPRLADERWIVLDGDGRLRMAHPFSGVPTDFLVTGPHRSWFANCFWDALTVSAIVRLRLNHSTTIHTHCGHSRLPMLVDVGPQGPAPGPARIHFAVPLRDWWEDITFT